MYRKVSDIFPITYGEKAPSGFGGAPDRVQQAFNKVMHLSMHPHDASYDEIDAGMVVRIPSWEHWIAFGELPSKMGDGEVRNALAVFKATLDAIARVIRVDSFDRHDYLARAMLMNELVFEEWLADYALRTNVDLETARNDVLDAMGSAARSASLVGADTRPESFRKAEIEDFDLADIDFDPICHDHSVSYMHTRERIEAHREKDVRGLTIRNMNELGLSYRDIDSKHGYEIADDAEVVVVSLKTGKVTGHTGKFVARIVDAKAVEEAARTVEKVGEAISDALRLFSQPSQLFLCL